MKTKNLFNQKEQAALLMAAYEVQGDSNADKFLAKVERVLLDKMFEQSETDRLIALAPTKS